MSIHLPAGRLVRSSTMPSITTSLRPRVQHIRPLIPRRTLFGFLRRNREVPVLDPMSEQFRTKKQPEGAFSQGQAVPRRGDLAQGSIFDDGTTTTDPSKLAHKAPGSARDTSPRNRDVALMAPVLDPRPQARERWERKMVIRDIRKRGRINKSTLLARIEREHTAKSKAIKTSLKKLMPLARQIAGKPVDDAIVQMRFSRKKAARDVLRHLEAARDEAVVVRGMGLGKVKLEGKESGEGAATEGVVPQDPDRMLVIDKEGKRRIVTDRTAMYVDQAWIGRCTPDHGVDRRAKGRRFVTDRPFTSLTLLLKEEQTRIREMNERADKRAKAKPWVNLPDRPVTRQTQYPLW